MRIEGRSEGRRREERSDEKGLVVDDEVKVQDRRYDGAAV